MKKLITLLMLALTVSAAFAQTTVTPSKDTVIYKPSVYVPEHYVPAQFIPAVYTPSSNTPASLVIKPYKAPATTTPPATTAPPSTTQPTYTVSGPIVAKANTTYENLLIDLKGAITTGISVNVPGVTIKNCKIINGTGYGINVNNGNNVVITNNFINNIGFAINVYNSASPKCNYNQISNVNGMNNSLGAKALLSHAIQYNTVSGPGIQCNYNIVENVLAATDNTRHPHDILNFYKVNGMAGDSAQMIGNWIRGGQYNLWPTNNSGAAGCVVGDLGGSYQVCRDNILVNPGYVGIQAQGGTHIKVDHNLVYSSATPASLVGMAWGNWSGTTSSDVTYAYNKVKWFNHNNQEDDSNTSQPGLTVVNNTWGANIDASILPASIITMK